MFSKWDLKLFAKREDLVHPVYGGNKFRKLKYNLGYARENNFDTLLTFGGAFSNHIAATAFAGKEFGFKTIGIIRGDELTDAAANLSKTLTEGVANGMTLKFVSRAEYNRKYEADYLTELQAAYPNAYIIPEGGSNPLAVKGCKEIVDDIEIEFDYIVCAVGTGTTLIGIASGLKPHQNALGIEVYKNKNPELENLEYAKQYPLSVQNLNCKIANYSFGSYGKSTAALDAFCKDFYLKHQITIEPIYTGKMFYGIYDLIKQGYFKTGSTIIAVHTGGLQYL